MSRWIIGVLVSGLVFAVAQPVNQTAAADPIRVEDVTSELVCPCASGLTVATCQKTLECPLAAKMESLTDELLTEGLTKDEVLSYFVDVYGESILIVPKKEGFALSAWLVPFLAVGLGIATISWLSWRWARGRRDVSAEAAVADQPDLTTYREQVERDLGRLG